MIKNIDLLTCILRQAHTVRYIVVNHCHTVVMLRLRTKEQVQDHWKTLHEGSAAKE